MHKTNYATSQSVKAALKQQLIATVAGNDALAAEELKLLLKVATPETLRGVELRNGLRYSG